MLILGANPIASNGSIMTAAGVADRLKAIQKRDGKFVVVDPRKTETAQKADQHVFIRPGTDVFLLLALVNCVFAGEHIDLGHLEDVIASDDVETIRQMVAEFTPEAIADVTGISADIIHQLAQDFVNAESAVCYGRVGVSMQEFGGMCNWLVNVLNILTDNMDSAGGAMFTMPAFDVVGLTTMMGSTGRYGRFRSRVRDLPSFGGELPVSALGEEILTEGDGQIKAMVTMAGNPVLSTPNGGQLDEAFAGLDYMVSVDIYINETTRHANIILPPATGLETDHYDLVFHYLAVRDTSKFSEALFEPEDGAMLDWQILLALRNRMEGTDKPAHKYDFFRRMSLQQMIDLGLRTGPYGSWVGRRPIEGGGLTLKKLKDNPHGIDFGALKPILKQRLCTPDNRIDLAPDIITDDIERAKSKLAQSHSNHEEGYNFALIGRRHLRSNNSWMHNSKRLVRGKDRCTLFIHPLDADALGIGDADTVEVLSRVGRVEITAQVTEDIMQGVVSIPHGWGHGKKGVRMQVAQEHAGVSINDLTDDQRLDDLTGNVAFSGVPVKVCALGEPS